MLIVLKLNPSLMLFHVSIFTTNQEPFIYMALGETASTDYRNRPVRLLKIICLSLEVLNKVTTVTAQQRYNLCHILKFKRQSLFLIIFFIQNTEAKNIICNKNI